MNLIAELVVNRDRWSARQSGSTRSKVITVQFPLLIWCQRLKILKLKRTSQNHVPTAQRGFVNWIGSYIYLLNFQSLSTFCDFLVIFKIKLKSSLNIDCSCWIWTVTIWIVMEIIWIADIMLHCNKKKSYQLAMYFSIHPIP